MWLRVLALAGFLGGGPGMAVAADPPPLPLPVPAGIPLSSNFGEYRPGHYHGGLDFAAGPGTPVRAPASGWVFRVRASGVGYGRSIYFRLEDGRTLLFAHLSRYSESLTRLVESEQDRLGRYEVDLYPEAGAYPAEAGATLGWTGHSGAGPDHLHAEVRIGPEASVAVNPFFEGWVVPDSIAPNPRRLRLAPAGPGALIDHGYAAKVIPLERNRMPPVTVRGPVRLWLDASDDSFGSYRIAPYRVAALLDGEPAVEVLFDRFDWNYAREVERTFFDLPESGHWIALFETPGLRRSMLRSGVAGADWSESLAPGTHHLEIKVSDAAGNRREVTVRIEVEPADLDAGLPAAPFAPGFRTQGRFLEIGFPATDPGGVSAVGPSGRLESLDGCLWHTPDRTGWQIGDPGAAGSGFWSFHRAGESGGSPLGRGLWIDGDTPGGWFDAGILRIEAGGESVYEPTWILAEAMADPEVNRNGGWPIRLQPEDLALREPITVEFPVPPGTSRRGLALMSGEGAKMSFEGADTSGAGIRARIRRLGLLTVIRDETPPGIELIAPRKNQGRIREFQARIVDEGVGVTWTGLEIRFEGKPLVAEWDPEAKILTAFLRTALLPGQYEFSVEASDRVGNRSEASRTFTVN